jgi:hypothetical protein
MEETDPPEQSTEYMGGGGVGLDRGKKFYIQY